MRAYRIRTCAPQATLEDLHTRLTLTRWPDEPAADNWKFGTSPSYLRELTDYWRNSFDWRKQEARLNKLAYPESLVGIHFTEVPFTRLLVRPTDQSEAEQMYFKNFQQWRMG